MTSFDKEEETACWVVRLFYLCYRVKILGKYRPCGCVYSVSLSSLFAVRPTAVTITTRERHLESNKTYEIECKAQGSRPLAVISWWKGPHHIRHQDKVSAEHLGPRPPRCSTAPLTTSRKLIAPRRPRCSNPSRRA